MNREDLRWALDAALPHVGKPSAGTDVVGLKRDNDFNLMVYATDKYTLAVARVMDGPAVDVQLKVGEARDLLRFVRPGLVHEHKQEVIMVTKVTRGNELHVGLLDEDGDTYDSAVFETTHSRLTLDFLEGFTDKLVNAPDEFKSCIYNPKIFGRFAKAGRHETDRVHLMPKHTSNRNGVALVTVGDHFVGAIAGMTYELPVAAERPLAITERTAV